MADDNQQKPTTEQMFGQQIKLLRDSKGWSQRQLADALGMEATAITRIERGQRALRLGEAVAIASALDTSVERVLRDIGDPAASARELRSLADTAMHTAERHLWEFLWRLQQVREALNGAPKAIPGTSPEKYYEWVFERVQRIQSSDRDAYRVYELDQSDAEILTRIAMEMVTHMVVIGDEPGYAEGDEGGDDG